MIVCKIDEWQPVVNFADTDTADEGGFWGPRIIPDYQLFYVVRGAAELSIGAERLRIAPGEAAFYGPDCAHLLRIAEPTEYYSLHFLWRSESTAPVHPGPAILPGALDGRRGAELRVQCSGAGEAALPHRLSAAGVETLLSRIVKEYRGERPGYALMLRALLTELLLQLVRPLLPDGASRESPIDAALHAMRDRPEHAWTVAELAQLCGYHPSYFTALFRREMGSRPKDYLIDERMKLAKQALLRGERLEAIAGRLGYGSMHYFSSHFKKQTGMTPSQFRQRPDR